MNGIDIAILIFFALFVIICTVKGFANIISKWGAFLAATIVSKLFGGIVGEMLLGSFLGAFAPIVGTLLLFVILYILLRIIFKGVAKLIKKLFNAGVLDHILGFILGVAGGVAAVFLLAFVFDIALTVISALNLEPQWVEAVNDTVILKKFMSFFM